MELTAEGLAAFYATPQGDFVRRAVLRQVRRIWPDAGAGYGLGLGYARPYLDDLAGPAAKTEEYVPPALTDDEDAEAAVLPFADAAFDWVFAVHALETAEGTREMLRQIWRVLAAEGRLILVVPNRLSLWAVMDASPFAAGRPFRRAELNGLLCAHLFAPQGCRPALFPPPRRKGKKPHAALLEKIGPCLMPAFGGALVTAAKKSVYGVTPLIDPCAAKVFTPASLKPQLNPRLCAEETPPPRP